MKFYKTYSKNKKSFLSNILLKTLTIGLLFNNILVSFEGVLSEDGRYETFEDNNITVNDILEEDSVNLEVYGNTLVNLIKNGKTSQTRPNSLADFQLIKSTYPGKKYTLIFNSNARDVYGGFLVNNSTWGDGFTKTESISGLIEPSPTYERSSLRWGILFLSSLNKRYS